MVGARQSLVERDVLLDDRGAPGHRGDRDVDAGRVIRQPHRTAEACTQRVHRSQICLLHGRRVVAHTVQERDRRIAGLADRGDRLRDLVERRHPRRHDQRATLTREVTQERQVRDLSRRDFEERHAQRLERVGARLVERRREEEDPALGALVAERGVRRGPELELAQHLQLAFTAARGLHLVRGLRRRARHQRLRAKRLELHRVGARRGGRRDELARQLEIAVVVDAGLRDHEHGSARADQAVADAHGRRAHGRSTDARAASSASTSATTPTRRSVSRPSTGWR